jgi:translocation and assembly module TamB
MSKETRRKKILWVEHLLWVLGTWTLLAVALGVIALWSGLANPLLRRALVNKLESLTGARVEARTVSIGWFSLNATVRGLVVHGTEPTDTEPLLSVEETHVGLRIDSFWGRKVSLDELILKEPRVHVRVEKNGKNNLPTLKRDATDNRPLQELLVNLRVRHVQIENGWILYNNVKSALALEGGDLRLNLMLGGAVGNELYLGTFNWDSIGWAAEGDMPVPANVSAKFTLSRTGLALEQGIVDAARSHLDLQAEIPDLSTAAGKYRYRGWLDLLDVREAFRTPEVPLGKVELRGAGNFSDGNILGNGSFAGDNITLSFADFHSANLIARSSYVLDTKGIILPDFTAYALGGNLKGRVNMRYQGLKFRADTKLENIRLSQVAPAIDHAGFPVDQLHWDSVLSADTVETWRENFKDFEVAGQMHWEEPETVRAGHLPVNGDWKLRYRYTSNTLELEEGEFATPMTSGTVTGFLAPKNALLDLHLQVGKLEDWNDFIHAVAGHLPGTPEASVVAGGSLEWTGKIIGSTDGRTFQGHFHGQDLHYDKIRLDSMDGDMAYSPSELLISHGRARRGGMEATVDGNLELKNWTFLPESQWSSEISLEKVPLENLEQLGGVNYPVSGLLTGQFHGRGTRAEPTLSGVMDLADGSAYGVTFSRLRGTLNVLPDEVRLSNAELRFFAPGTEKTGGAGIVTGAVAYRYADHSLTTDLVGASLPLASFAKIQSKSLPMGGQITFRLKSSGPLTAPVAEGSLRVVNFQVGSEVIGSFEGDLHSNGKEAELILGSAMSTGAISGDIKLGLADPLPLNGKVTIKNINLDPYVLSSMHLDKFTGHGSADGDITVTGELRHPETMVVDANFSKLILTYGNVQLENSGPIHLTSSKDNLKILAAAMTGTDTNASLTGSIQFTGRRAVSLKLNGSLDLRLISAYISDFDFAGHADINATMDGTLDKPRIIGRVKLNNASARSADFPTGLSNLKGDVVFDANRLFLENVTGEAGGGTLTLSGSANYSEKPMRYDISARTDRLRIRYPEGMSWVLGGSLRLSGTSDGALLSGKVVVQRVSLNEGLGSAGILVSSRDTGTAGSSSFMRNLQFDIEASSSPDANMEWPGAHLEAEANLRVRGTAEHPIMLGHIHVLSGDLYFRDNHYRVTRGDLNFANPFRLDPVINVEATTTVQQYEITLNFTGQASKMNLSFRSDPPLPGNDIVTLLALGQTGSEAKLRTGGSQSGTTGASALVSEAISSQLGGRVERLFGITRFRVDPGLAGVSSTGAGQNAAARITVEQQVTRNLSITYVSNVSSTQQQVIEVIYNVNRTVSIVGLRDQNGTFGVDIKLKKRLP